MRPAHRALPLTVFGIALGAVTFADGVAGGSPPAPRDPQTAPWPGSSEEALACAARINLDCDCDRFDQLRAVLSRIDGEANVARLHPDQASGHAQAAARFAREALDLLTGLSALWPAGVELARAGAALEEATRRQEPADVRSAAIAVQMLVRRLDAQIRAAAPAW
jgi:hypothetical protein